MDAGNHPEPNQSLATSNGLAAGEDRLSAQTPPAPLPKLAEYELLQRLGSGGMGAVYKARHLRLNKIVAVKMMQESRLDDPSATARFDREMKAVGAVDHPNIVRAMDAREIDGQRILVMEFVEGIDLALLVRRTGPLPIADACEIIRQAALGMQSAHDRGLVHRDIKPSNLMLTVFPSTSGRGAGGEGAEGVVKVLDLGLALFQVPPLVEEEVSALGQTLGTAEYTSPEQVSDSHKIDGRADIYSLGCTFYKLLAGQAPFEGPGYPTRVEKLSAHLLKTVPDIRTVRPDVSEKLAELLAQMTAKSPSARLASMADVAERLTRLCADHNLPALLKRAEGGVVQTAADARTDKFRSSGLVSTGGSKRLQAAAKIEMVAVARGGRRKWRRVLALTVAGTGLLLVAFLVVRWRDSTGRETTVETSEPSRVTIDKTGTVSIVPMQTDEKPTTVKSAGFVDEPVALKDFFKDVPGRWIPVLRTERDLEQIRPRNPMNVSFRSGVVDVKGRYFIFPSIKSAVQGIRAKVKWDVQYAQLTLREGPEGHVLAFFHPDGTMWSGVTFEEHGKRTYRDIPAKARYRGEPKDDFVSIGFAAIGPRFLFECNGSSREYIDKRLTYGSPGFGAKVSGPAGHVLFKDIEVFVPDKDAEAAAGSAPPADGADGFTNSIGATFVHVKPGQFYMGSPSNEPFHLASEELHDVRISKSFYIGTCEVTQGQYQAIIGENPSSYSAKGKNSYLVKGKDTGRYPVECVSWDDAQKFCDKLSAREERRYRLPTEAEWEYCCRAATETPYCFGSKVDSNNVNSSQTFGGPFRVGVFPENKWGLCDMHGNVAEWCQDYYSAMYYKESPATDPTGPATGANRVVRGGSWNTPASRCRSAARSSEPPDTRRDDLGFRIATE